MFCASAGFSALADGWRMVIDPPSETMGYVHALSVTKDMASLTFCLPSLAKWLKSQSLKVNSSVQCKCDASSNASNTRLAFRLLDKHAELQHGKLLTSVTLCTMTKPTCAQHTWLFWVFVLVARETFAPPALSASCAQYQISRHGTCVPAKTSG